MSNTNSLFFVILHSTQVFTFEAKLAKCLPTICKPWGSIPRTSSSGYTPVSTSSGITAHRSGGKGLKFKVNLGYISYEEMPEQYKTFVKEEVFTLLQSYILPWMHTRSHQDWVALSTKQFPQTTGLIL